MNLPTIFEEKMKMLLGEEFSDYIKCYDEPRFYGLRVNTKKISVEKTDFIMTEIKCSLRNTLTILRDYIIFKSRVR